MRSIAKFMRAYMVYAVGNVAYNFVKNGFSFRKAIVVDNVAWEYVVTEEEHLKELHAYR